MSQINPFLILLEIKSTTKEIIILCTIIFFISVIIHTIPDFTLKSILFWISELLFNFVEIKLLNFRSKIAFFDKLSPNSSIIKSQILEECFYLLKFGMYVEFVLIFMMIINFIIICFHAFS